jgi:exo-beta-1,3-glucanase (GH17 family)
MRGINYGPFRSGQSPEWGIFPTPEQILEDVPIIAPMGNVVRLYTTTHGQDLIVQQAASHGFRVVPSAWLSNDATENQDQIESLVQLLNNPQTHLDVIEFVVVGSETIWREEFTALELIDVMAEIRDAIPAGIAVTAAEQWHIYRDYPELGAAADVIFINIHPYWEDVPIDDAVQFVVDKYQLLQSLNPGKRVVISETGWPSDGDDQPNLPAATLENTLRFWDEFLIASKQHNIEYLGFEAFDELWKGEGSPPDQNIGNAEQNWGLFDHDRNPKFALTSLNPWVTGSDSDNVLASGSSGQAWIEGLAGDDTLSGGSFADRLFGDEGDDRLFGAGGHDVLDGGAGNDSAVFSAPRVLYSVTQNGAQTIVSGPDGTDTLTNIETLIFDELPEDFNGDGKSDFLWQNNDGRAAVWLVDGTTLLDSAVVGSNPGPVWHIEGTGDFDQNGRSDIMWQHNDGRAAIWFLNGTTLVGSGFVATNPGPSWDIIDTGHFNADGTSDLLWWNTDGRVAVWTLDGTTQTGGAVVGGNPGPAWQAKASGNFNGDGESDILWQHADGRAGVWILDGMNFVQGGVVGENPGPSWHVKDSGDFNGDGKSDILWQNADGRAAIWLVDGLSYVSGSVIGSNPGSVWDVIGAADYNGDGNADMLWQRADGQAAVWLMDGFTVIDAGLVGTNPGTAWHLDWI